MSITERKIQIILSKLKTHTTWEFAYLKHETQK
jgi:hypothetical protein